MEKDGTELGSNEQTKDTIEIDLEDRDLVR
jgi:hypothetical protein